MTMGRRDETRSKLTRDVIKHGNVGGEGAKVQGGQGLGAMGEHDAPKLLGTMSKCVAERPTLQGNE